MCRILFLEKVINNIMKKKRKSFLMIMPLFYENLKIFFFIFCLIIKELVVCGLELNFTNEYMGM